MRREKRQGNSLEGVFGRAQQIDGGEGGLDITGIHSIREVEVVCSSKASKEIRDVVLLQRLSVRTYVGDKHRVKGANERNYSLCGGSKRFPNSIRAAQLFTSKYKLTERPGIGDNVHSGGVAGSRIEEGFFQCKGFSQHAAVIGASLRAAGKESSAASPVMVRDESKAHLSGRIAAISDDSGVDVL